MQIGQIIALFVTKKGTLIECSREKQMLFSYFSSNSMESTQSVLKINGENYMVPLPDLFSHTARQWNNQPIILSFAPCR